MAQSWHGGWLDNPFNAEIYRRFWKTKGTETGGPVCVIDYQQNETVKNESSVFESNFKKINEADEALKVNGWVTFVGQYKLSINRICMGVQGYYLIREIQFMAGHIPRYSRQ